MHVRGPAVWILASVLVSAMPLASAVAGESVFVQGDEVRLRQSPSTAAPIVAALQQGEELELHGQRGEWVNVGSAGGAEGWVHHTLVGPEPPSTEP